MINSIGAAFALHLMMQAAQAPRPVQATVVCDSTAADSAKRRAPKRLPVTADLIRMAFRDDRTRELVLSARSVRAPCTLCSARAGVLAPELRCVGSRPRSPRWNLAVGSLWVDTQTGQLVRAAYRLAVPMSVWTSMDEHSRDEGSRANPILLKVVKAIASPFQVQITGVAIEY